MLKTKKVEVPDVTYTKDNKELKIYREVNPMDPREYVEPLGTMKCSHGRYDLGDKTFDADKFDGWQDVKKHIMEKEDPDVIMGLFLYDHSGLRMKIESFAGHVPQGHARFDSGQVGFIYASSEDMGKEKIKEALKAEVEQYDCYLSGEVYRFVLEEDDEQVDACSGFYGSAPDVLDYIAEAAGIDSLEDWEEDCA